MLTVIISLCLPFAALFAAYIVSLKVMKKTGSGKKAFAKHLITLALALVVCFSLMAIVASAEESAVPEEQETAALATDSGAGLATGLGFIGAALSIGLAAVGAGIALSASAPAAIGAIAEDPKSFGKSMIFVALGEAIAIYGFIVAFLIVVKIPDLPLL